jgi:hypothetical protein
MLAGILKNLAARNKHSQPSAAAIENSGALYVRCRLDLLVGTLQHARRIFCDAEGKVCLTNGSLSANGFS